MRIADIMTREVITVSPATTVQAIAALLVDREISAVPVVDEAGRLLGIVSEADLLRRSEAPGATERHRWLELFADPDSRAEAFLKAHGRTAADVMTQDLEVATPATTLEEAARLIRERRVKRLPVVEDGRLVGIVARADLLRGLEQRDAAAERPTPDDLAIKQRFEAVARQAGFVSVGAVTVVVQDGVVHLWGLAATATERRALELAAAGIGGVREVRNHLVARDELPEDS